VESLVLISKVGESFVQAHTPLMSPLSSLLLACTQLGVWLGYMSHWLCHVCEFSSTISSIWFFTGFRPILVSEGLVQGYVAVEHMIPYTGVSSIASEHMIPHWFPVLIGEGLTLIQSNTGIGRALCNEFSSMPTSVYMNFH